MEKMPILVYEGDPKKKKENIEEIMQKIGYKNFKLIVSEENKELIAVSRKGVVIRISVGSISVLGRATQGVRIMRVESGDGLASVVVV